MSETDETKKINEALYEHNLELAVKNKTLSLLEKLYKTSILNLTPEVMADNIAKIIREDLNLEFAGLFAFSKEKDLLNPISFSKSERLVDTLNKLGFLLKDVKIENVSKNNFFKKSVYDRADNLTNNLEEVWMDAIKAEHLKEIKEQSHIKTILLYPLMDDKEVLGALLLGLNRDYDTLNTFEKEAIKSFINVISLSLNKVYLYKDLQDTNEKLHEANQGQASLMHFMNHQVKGRLGNAKNIFAELLTDDYGNMPEFAKPLLEKGLEETTTGVNYVQNILKGASAENGTLPYDMKPMDFKAVVEEVFAKQKEYGEKKGLTMNLKIEDGAYSMTGDVLELSEAVKNLIDNSVTYTPTGSISVTLSNISKTILLKIQDTGVGITPEDKQKLFQSGGRGADSLKINTNSTGYGLVFVKRVVEAHKGQVSVDSEGAGKGSTFHIELPQA